MWYVKPYLLYPLTKASASTDVPQIPVNDICETTGEKPNTVAKRFNIIANRHGLKLSASTTTASRAPTRATTTTPGRGRAIKTNEDETVATPAQKSKPSTRKKKPATVKAEEALDNELAENNDEGAETATNLKLKSAVPKTVVGKKTNTEISKKPKTQPAVGDKDELEDGTANEHSESTTCDTPTPAPKQASTAITTPNADSTAVSPSTPQTKSPSKYNVKPPPRPPSRSLSKTPGPVTTPTQTKKRKLTPTSGTDIGKKQIKQELAEFQETRIAELNTKMTKGTWIQALK